MKAWDAVGVMPNNHEEDTMSNHVGSKGVRLSAALIAGLLLSSGALFATGTEEAAGADPATGAALPWTGEEVVYSGLDRKSVV